jgi:hypothetical protein
MIMERGARPDALPNARAKPKRGKTTLAAVVVVGVVALAFGLGFGAGAHLRAIGDAGPRAAPRARPALSAGVLSAREWFRYCSLTAAEANPVPTNEELEWLLAQMQARYAEPKWGTP